MTLRTRLILSYVLIIFLCLGIAAISVSLVLQNYRDQVVMTRLDDLTRPIVTQLRSLIRGQTSILNVWTTIQDQAQRNNIFILVVDDKGNLLRQASPDSFSPTINVAGGLPHGFSQDAHGLFTTIGGQPFVYTAFTIGRVSDPAARSETVVLCQPRGSLAVIIAGVIIPFILAALIAVIASFLLAFLVARSVYKPVQSLSRAAETSRRVTMTKKCPLAALPR